MKELKSAKPRSLANSETLEEDVRGIISEVRAGGDAALAAFNKQYDGSTRTGLRVTAEEIKEAYDILPDEDEEDIKEAAKNIRAFAEMQRKSISEVENFEPLPGVLLGHRAIPVNAVCCYVPGGSYPLFSTALMLGIPAHVAGVERIIACTPVKKGTDKVDPYTLVALDVAGVNEIYTVGGAQAIAAAAYGTESIAPVDMIVGPGNSYVTVAKKLCYGQVGIDFLAGPTEVMVIADDSAAPDVIAADLLAQSEHDLVSKAILITLSEKLGEEVIKHVEEQLESLDTANIAGKSWADYGEVLLADSIEEAIKYANEYAPEHLELCLENPETIADKFINYGSMFLGQNTAEVFGDYASGTNHTLPTLGAARYTGGVWVGTFLKVCTHQAMTKEAAQKVAPLVSRLAEREGLSAHKAAAEKRK